MKYSIYLIMCSLIAGECLEPHKLDTKFDNLYDCLNKGYEESLLKSTEIGKEQINKHEIYIKFICKEDFILPKKKPEINNEPENKSYQPISISSSLLYSL